MTEYDRIMRRLNHAIKSTQAATREILHAGVSLDDDRRRPLIHALRRLTEVVDEFERQIPARSVSERTTRSMAEQTGVSVGRVGQAAAREPGPPAG
jgi:hypothetical protein